MLDVVTLGETMIQMNPQTSGMLRHARRFDRYVAGAESNVAIGLERLGHRAGWISRVGADEFGACVRSVIRGEGVDTTHVVEDENAPTGVYFLERRRTDRTRVYYYREGSAASRLSPDDLASDYIGQARYLHLTGITPALSASCRNAVWEAIRIATEQNVAISLDPNVRHKLWAKSEARSVLREMIPHTCVLLSGEGEAMLLAEEETPEAAARALQDLGPQQVVVRLGASGALAVGKDGELVRGGSIDVDVVDEIGAGDAFNAGFLTGLLRNESLERAVLLGNIVGGLATTVRGDAEGLPTWKEVYPYLETGSGKETVDR